MSAADALRPEAFDQWRARAEAELGGAPLRSLTPKRADGLVIEPFAVADRSREEGLGSRPTERSIALVVDERSFAVARPFVEGVDVVWARGAHTPLERGTRRVVLEPTPGFDRTSAGELLVLSDAWTESVLSPARPADARDAIGCIAAHEAGGGPVTQVAMAAAAMLDRARAIGSARPPALAVPISPEIFVEVSKLRALRRLTDRVLATLSEPVGVPIYARTDDRSTARLDRATNAIRASLGVAAAMLGGADCVGAVAMDALDASPSALGARLSRNTSLVLALESSLTATDDPARGSYYVEALTDRIARDAWELVREIERRGGLTAAAAWVRTRIDAERDARRAALRARAIPLVGVSRFAVADERVTSDGSLRDAAEFEALHVGAVPDVAVVVLGDRSAVEARAAFARELVEAGGMRVVEADVGSPRVVLIAAPDALFGNGLAEEIASLARRGAEVWIAGRPGAHEAALRQAGAAGFVFVGADVVDVLGRMRARATSSP